MGRKKNPEQIEPTFWVVDVHDAIMCSNLVTISWGV